MPEAYELIVRGSFREALDVLNTAIVIAPDYPLAYALRAAVFDQLGLHEQAEADRARERQIATTDGYPVADVVDGIATITMRRVRRGGHARREPRVAGRGIGGLVSPAVVGIIMIVGVTAAGAGGVMLALDAIDDGGGGGAVFNPTGVPSPTAVAGATEMPVDETVTPEPDPTADVSGSPYSLSSLVGAWKEAGLDVTVDGPSDVFEGFVNEATDLSVSGGGEYSVFVYEDASTTSADWTISGTSSPVPREGRSFPRSLSVWFNVNVIVVVWSDVPGAFEAFVDMTP